MTQLNGINYRGILLINKNVISKECQLLWEKKKTNRRYKESKITVSCNRYELNVSLFLVLIFVFSIFLLNCTGYRSLSKIKFVKNRLRTTIAQISLSKLYLLKDFSLKKDCNVSVIWINFEYFFLFTGSGFFYLLDLGLLLNLVCFAVTWFK